MLNSLIAALTQFITTLYATTGLVGIAGAMAIESCLIPLPSEIVMPLAGIMIHQHKILVGVPLPLSLVLVGLAGSLGCLLGSLVAYWIGYQGGRPLILKYGRYVLISQHDADMADSFFLKWGSATAFFSRLLPVVRTYISLPAGISKMPLLKFSIYTFLGSFPWCVLLAYLGTVLGDHLETLSPIFHTFDVVILVVLVVLVALYIWRHLRNDRLARVTHAIEEENARSSTTGSLHGQTPSSVNWGQPAQGSQAQWGQNTQAPSSQPLPSQPPQGWAQSAPGRGTPTPPANQQWGQQPPMQQQPQWGQQPPMQQPQWGQQPQQQNAPQQQRPQPGQPQWQQGGQPQPQQWPQPGQSGVQQPGQPQWGQQPQQWPPQGEDDRTAYRR